MAEIVKEKPVTSSLKLTDASQISPHNEAVYEAGKNLFFESLSIERDFTKNMVTLSASAIPVYLGLLQFALPARVKYQLDFMFLLVSPAFLFLISLALFSVAYFPKGGSYSLQIIEEIEKTLKETARKRGRMSKAGFILFIAAVITGIIVISVLLSKVYG